MSEDNIEEKIKALKDWKEALVGEIEAFKAEMQVPLDKKNKMEAHLAKRMKPVLKLIAKKQKNINEAESRIRMIEGKIEEFLKENENNT